MSAKRQNSQLRLAFDTREASEARRDVDEGTEALTARTGGERPASATLMEEVCDRENLKQALRRVRGNKGSAGVDGMTVEQLPVYLKTQWPAIRDQLLRGTYRPQPVRRVEIPKPDGGSASWASRRRSTASSSRRCCRSCNAHGTRRSPRRATGSGRIARPIRRSPRRSGTSPTA